MPTLNATPGAQEANSYATVQEANDYLNSDAWNALSADEKAAALISAARKLDTLKFGGTRASRDQGMLWPRDYVYDYEGYVLTDVPRQLKWANIEQALWDLQDSERLASNFELENFKSVSLGPLSWSGFGEAELVCRYARDLINSIGPGVLQPRYATTMVL